VDALVHRREHLTNLLSLSHTYFMVNMEAPSAWVSFLQSLVPAKPKAELYTALGLQKQGKTLFYRDLHDHLKHTTDRFVVAPGTRGMVMAVFTLPSFPYVFKCIRDHFDPPKDTSREEVKEKYLLAKHHDRIGRMSDTFEYSDVALPRDRFDPDLLVELRKKIPSLLSEEGEHVILRHLYIEQRLIPLDVYVRDALARGDETQLRRGIDELGQSLRELAEVNIFPGDLLPKNFGLTRYGRLVFYDYDEMTYLTSCNFRRIPKAPGYDEETSGEAWFSVDAGDVFPEEFSTFLFPPGPARDLFREIHGDLLDPAFWIAAQKRVKSGTEAELLPYPESTRLTTVRGQKKKVSLYP
jgi:isocitrate dehydrogenase kinase/phosphatase